MISLRRVAEMPWIYLVPGTVLVLVSMLGRIMFMEVEAYFPASSRVRLLVGTLGGALLLVGIAHGIRSLLQVSSIRVTMLVGPEKIFVEARRMVERCKGHEVIRATSITTAWPGSEDSETKYVEEFLRALASRCSAAKKDGESLLYKTVLGFPAGTRGEPPEHKKLSIINRRKFFDNEGAGDRLIMKYIETDWSLDVLIVGDSMIIGFPTLPRDRSLYLGLKIHNAEFVEHVAHWYDHCVLEGAQDLTWTPGSAATV